MNEMIFKLCNPGIYINNYLGSFFIIVVTAAMLVPGLVQPRKVSDEALL